MYLRVLMEARRPTFAAPGPPDLSSWASLMGLKPGHKESLPPSMANTSPMLSPVVSLPQLEDNFYRQNSVCFPLPIQGERNVGFVQPEPGEVTYTFIEAEAGRLGAQGLINIEFETSLGHVRPSLKNI